MKNVMNNSKKVFLMVALFATVIGYANNSKSFSISKNDANRTTLTLNNVKVGNLFTIKDENGITLYKESIQKSGIYTKGFDLTELPTGDYFFEIDKDMEVTSIPFKVVNHEVTFNKALSETTFKPVTVVKEDLVLVTQLSLNKTPLEIEVYYDGGSYTESYQLIHSETISDTKNIERIYKLPGLEKGSFKIIYRTEGKQFVEFI